MSVINFKAIDGIQANGSSTIANTLTVSANLIVDTDTLYVDAVTERIGINKTPTQGALDVSGNVYATGFHGNGANITSVNANNASYLGGIVASGYLRSTANDTLENSRLTVSNSNILISDGYLQLSDSQQINFGTGGDNILSGGDSGLSITGSNVAIDTNVLFVDTLNNRVGIGKTNPATALDVSGTITTTDINTTSDEKLKYDITVIENALEKIRNINGVQFKWKFNDKNCDGVIAQNVQKSIPTVIEDTGEFLTVNYNGLIGYLIEAIKELATEIDELKSNK